MLQASPVFSFANQAGLDMLETTLIALQEIRIESILDETGRKALCSEFNKIMQQVSHSLVFIVRLILIFIWTRGRQTE
jgi:MEKHLA domain